MLYCPFISVYCSFSTLHPLILFTWLLILLFIWKQLKEIVMLKYLQKGCLSVYRMPIVFPRKIVSPSIKTRKLTFKCDYHIVLRCHSSFTHCLQISFIEKRSCLESHDVSACHISLASCSLTQFFSLFITVITLKFMKISHTYSIECPLSRVWLLDSGY